MVSMFVWLARWNGTHVVPLSVESSHSGSVEIFRSRMNRRKLYLTPVDNEISGFEGEWYFDGIIFGWLAEVVVVGFAGYVQKEEKTELAIARNEGRSGS